MRFGSVSIKLFESKMEFAPLPSALPLRRQRYVPKLAKLLIALHLLHINVCLRHISLTY